MTPKNLLICFWKPFGSEPVNVPTFYNFLSVFQESCFHSWNHSTILNYDVSGLTQERGGERLLLFFPFCVLKSELISSKGLFFTNLFRASITDKTPSNSTKQLYWLFTEVISVLTTFLTSLSRLMFCSRPTFIITFWCFYLQLSWFHKKDFPFFIKYYYP